jgi:hypothetical protein
MAGKSPLLLLCTSLYICLHLWPLYILGLTPTVVCMYICAEVVCGVWCVVCGVCVYAGLVYVCERARVRSTGRTTGTDRRAEADPALVDSLAQINSLLRFRWDSCGCVYQRCV